ncbi:MAG: carbon-nitrogen hydrolase family protein [Acidobacteria bacterium]|nr:carbon-nitrogen hydrolase family protein [Acidobacteriota bacterium]
MTHGLIRIALANLSYPASPEASLDAVRKAVAEASSKGAQIICFPECFVPGYRALGKSIAPANPVFLEHAWTATAEVAAKNHIAVILGTERMVDEHLRATALVIDRRGLRVGFQDKVQLDPSEDSIYSPGIGRRLFSVDDLRFGIVICHEGWRYPETCRWAARRGAQIIFHPQFHEREDGGKSPSVFADPDNSFHEKALLCRAAENTCFVASVNCASPSSPTTSVVVKPDGTVLDFQPYGLEGLLLADVDLSEATGLLALRYKPLEL